MAGSILPGCAIEAGRYGPAAGRGHRAGRWPTLAGDAVLAAIAAARALLREDDIIGRFGGEEFAILLPRTSAAEAAEVAGRLRAVIRQRVPRPF